MSFRNTIWALNSGLSGFEMMDEVTFKSVLSQLLS